MFNHGDSDLVGREDCLACLESAASRSPENSMEDHWYQQRRNNHGYFSSQTRVHTYMCSTCVQVFNASSYPKPWPTLAGPASVTCTIGTIGRPCVADVIKLVSNKVFVRNVMKDFCHAKCIGNSLYLVAESTNLLHRLCTPGIVFVDDK